MLDLIYPLEFAASNCVKKYYDYAWGLCETSFYCKFMYHVILAEI